MDDQRICKCSTRCPVAAKLAGWIAIAISIPASMGQLMVATMIKQGIGGALFGLTLSLLFCLAALAAVYMIMGRKWAYNVVMILGLPTIIIPLLLLLQHREYDDFAAWREKHDMEARYWEP